MDIARIASKLTKRNVLFILSFIATIIVLSQVYLYFQLSTPTTKFRRSLDIDDVRELVRAGKDTGVTPILFDPFILEAWSKNAHIYAPGVCIFLCHVIGPLNFAVISSQEKDDTKEVLMSRLAQLGFTVTRFESPEGELAHIFLLRQGSPLHIVVLHPSSAGFYRQFSLDGAPHNIAQVKQYITKDAWNRIKVDAAYDRFQHKIVEIDGVRLAAPSSIDKFSTDYKNSHFTPCNETRATYYNLKHPYNESPEASRFKHRAWKLLAKAKTILDKIKVPFWLSSGTCLGFYRQCDIIPWSMDVDIGIFIEDYNTKIITEFERKGLQLTHKFGKVEDSFELSFKEDEIKLDIFFFYTEGASMWNGGTQARTGKKFKYIFPAFSMCWTEFLELKVRIPCQTRQYIEANYGSNWFTPVKTWDWKASPPNVQENGQWPQEEWTNVIYVKQ